MSKTQEKKKFDKFDKIDYIFLSIGIILAIIACIPGKVY